jgi:hypothetical protein
MAKWNKDAITLKDWMAADPEVAKKVRQTVDTYDHPNHGLKMPFEHQRGLKQSYSNPNLLEKQLERYYGGSNPNNTNVDALIKQLPREKILNALKNGMGAAGAALGGAYNLDKNIEAGKLLNEAVESDTLKHGVSKGLQGVGNSMEGLGAGFAAINPIAGGLTSAIGAGTKAAGELITDPYFDERGDTLRKDVSNSLGAVWGDRAPKEASLSPEEMQKFSKLRKLLQANKQLDTSKEVDGLWPESEEGSVGMGF